MALTYCPSCGAQISNGAQWCSNCGAPVANPSTATHTPNRSQTTQVCPEDHLTKAILVTIFCCQPLGIPAIVNAAGVNNAFMSGNYALAEEKSAQAKKWIKWAIIAGAIFWTLYILYIIVYCLIIGVAAGAGY